jgi:hypothetical protein
MQCGNVAVHVNQAVFETLWNVHRYVYTFHLF